MVLKMCCLAIFVVAGGLRALSNGLMVEGSCATELPYKLKAQV